MKPFIIDQSFLNQDELKDINTKVLMLRDHWTLNSVENVEKSILLGMLPSASHSEAFSVKNIDVNNEIMFKNFSHYYDKIKNKLSSYYNVPVNYSSDFQYPGFHIYLNDNGEDKVSIPNVNFHMDRFPRLINRMPPGKIESVIIPITLPSNGAHLLFNGSGNRTNFHRTMSLPTDEVFNYTPGMMAAWPGDLYHSIGPFILLNSSEYRITMQMHINFRSDRGTIFW
jgi:hypothetical protein